MPITRRDYFKPIQIGGSVLWLDGADPVTGFSQPSTTGVPCSSCPGTQVSPVISPDS